jgi:hypothetical protein
VCFSRYWERTGVLHNLVAAMSLVSLTIVTGRAGERTSGIAWSILTLLLDVIWAPLITTDLVRGSVNGKRGSFKLGSYTNSTHCLFGIEISGRRRSNELCHKIGRNHSKDD